MAIVPVCRSCGTHIVWAVTEAGKNAPVEKQMGGNVVLDPSLLPDEPATARVVRPGTGTHVNHFATCPQAPSWRKS